MQKHFSLDLLPTIDLGNYMRKNSIKSTRINGEVQRVLAEIIRGDIKDPRIPPMTSVVAVDDGEIIGAILCGHDGRRGCFYHVCVKITHRKHGIGKKMAAFAMQKLQEEGINKVSLIAFTIFSDGCCRGFFNSSTAFGASYIGKPKSRFTSAIYAV